MYDIAKVAALLHRAAVGHSAHFLKIWYFLGFLPFWLIFGLFLGLLLVMPGEQIEGDMVYDIAKVAALLHRAADMDQKPSIKETKFLLPKPALSAKDIKPPQWVNMVSKVKD